MQINKVELSPGVTKKSSYLILQSSENCPKNVLRKVNIMAIVKQVRQVKLAQKEEEEKKKEQVLEQEQYWVVKHQKKSWKGSIKLFSHSEQAATILQTLD